ncbi:DUF871 domain-containing protein [Enterococcus sp. DIV0756]|uniref:DUF871 domain-containing protein n=1 Tax=Enterococcus sp. DIV0756 TaxID=2774636 RepID=UPI003F6862D8
MTFRQLGLSIYPDHSDFSKDKDYLALGKKYGYSRLFMSMLEADDILATKQKFSRIIAVAKELGYLTIIDISPRIFEKLRISYQDLRFFAELGVDGIRLDQGFDGNTEALISYNPYGLIIELNMSNDVAYLENILSYQANKPYLFGCHNFYPQVGTGLTEEFFLECSERFKKNGIHTAAFVASQHGEQGPWNVNDGLPTLESDRYLPIQVQAKKLFATGFIDDVIIGNAYATEEELKALAEMDRYQLQLKVDFLAEATELERKIACDMQHFRRGDTNALVARSTQSRVIYKEEETPPHTNNIEFKFGDVLIGNDQFGIYKNELQIVLTPHKDTRKNKIGRISKEELVLLKYLNPWTKFNFI